MAADQLLAHYLSPIGRLLADESIADIFVDRYDRVYFSKAGAYTDAPDCRWANESALVAALNQIANHANGHVLSKEQPLLDARLQDGSRVAAALPPLTRQAQATIRVARSRHFALRDLVPAMLPESMVPFLVAAMARYANVVICGPTDSGKTTLLRSLLGLAAQDDRLFVVEDTAELNLVAPRMVCHEVAKNNAGKLQLTDSIRATLRNAPTRIVVGEIRDEHALSAYLEVLEAGFRGGLVTLHAPSALGALHRMDMILMRRASMNSLEAVRFMVRDAIDAVVFCKRGRDGVRRVEQVAVLDRGEPKLVWQWRGVGGGWEVVDQAAIDAFVTDVHPE